MRYRIPARLAYIEVPVIADGSSGERTDLLLRPLPGGPTLGLTGVAALIWCRAADGMPDVAAAVADSVSEPVDRVRSEVEDYLDVLVSRGLLEVDATERTRRMLDS